MHNQNTKSLQSCPCQNPKSKIQNPKSQARREHDDSNSHNHCRGNGNQHCN
jgi:hypothetical protein